MQGVRTKEVTIISDNEVSRWHNPVQYGSNTFFFGTRQRRPPPQGGGVDKGGGGWTWGGVGTRSWYMSAIQNEACTVQHSGCRVQMT